MPIFDESYEDQQQQKHHRHSKFIYSLEDYFRRGVPVTSIEFNPPPVSCLEKQNATYWRNLTSPDKEDEKVLKALEIKYKAMLECMENDVFMSITDSAAGVLRLHNLSMLGLLRDPAFCLRFFKTPPLDLNPDSTVIHLTRNHSVQWLRDFLIQCDHLGFHQILVITGDPLKEVKLATVTASEAAGLQGEAAALHRLKNSVELLRFIRDFDAKFFLGVGHNPFLKKSVGENHLSAKLEAGARFIITQPIAYYQECWTQMDEFLSFYRQINCQAPIIVGVFNYSVPCGSKGFNDEIFQKRYKFWKRLFGFVPEGVRLDYERGLNGVEILARSINEMRKKGLYHFDVMNAERMGISILKSRQRMAHELDRLAGSFDHQGINPF